MWLRRWEALLVVMDNKPFGDLHHILQEVADDRVWVFAEWVTRLSAPLALASCEHMQKDTISNLPTCLSVQVGIDFTPKIDGRWTAGYHERLYNLTDDAIRSKLTCS